MAIKVLIYDGQCAYCRGFVRLVRALDFRKRFFVLPYEREPAQALLRAQFGESFGFAMFLFEAESVSWGREAAKRVVQALSLPGASVAFWLYPTIVKFISRVTRRERTVCGPECFSHIQSPLRGEGSESEVVPLNAQVKLSLDQIFK